jgi:hypothetical protein
MQWIGPSKPGRKDGLLNKNPGTIISSLVGHLLSDPLIDLRTK